jgi:uncharacterized protein YdhG (YjbR/CyaY superfamily)
MNQDMSTAKKSTRNATKRSSTNVKLQKGLSAEEIAAMKETLKERKASASKEEAEKAALEAIDKLPEPERNMARRLHTIIMTTAPNLSARTWYGMPAYTKDDHVLCYFQSALKFKTRYATIGFSDRANLDEGDFWPVVFALKELTPSTEAKFIALLKKAIS